MPNKKIDKPEPGKIYSLTGAPGTNCIANGNTWADSQVIEKTKTNPLDSMTNKEIKELMKAACLGFERSDFSDDGSDLEELKEIMEGGI